MMNFGYPQSKLSRKVSLMHPNGSLSGHPGNCPPGKRTPADNLRRSVICPSRMQASWRTSFTDQCILTDVPQNIRDGAGIYEFF